MGRIVAEPYSSRSQVISNEPFLSSLYVVRRSAMFHDYRVRTSSYLIVYMYNIVWRTVDSRGIIATAVCLCSFARPARSLPRSTSSIYLSAA